MKYQTVLKSFVYDNKDSRFKELPTPPDMSLLDLKKKKNPQKPTDNSGQFLQMQITGTQPLCSNNHWAFFGRILLVFLFFPSTEMLSILVIFRYTGL